MPFKASLKIYHGWCNFYNNQHQRLSLDRLDTLCLLLSCYFFYFMIYILLNFFSMSLSMVKCYQLFTYNLFRNSSSLSSLIVPFGNIFRTIEFTILLLLKSGFTITALWNTPKGFWIGLWLLLLIKTIV
jgi:hypothetical protein